MKRRVRAWLMAALVCGLQGGLCAAAQAGGFQSVEDGLRPLKERLAAIDLELPPLQARMARLAAPDEGPQARRERALAWVRLELLLQEQAQLKEELADAQRAARDPMRLH